MGDFPFDVQTCRIKFSSQTQIDGKFRLLPSPTVLLDYYVESDEWDLINATAKEGYRRTSEFNISVMEVDLKVARRTGYYWINLIIPCMLISLLVTAVFAMPSDAGEKISFSVTILLAFTVYQLIVAGTLPKTSEDTPIMCK
jgi:hypothetical protein